MKRIVLFFAFFSLLSITKAQNNFAPIGATWIYEFSYEYFYIGPIRNIKSIGDTIIQGKQCRIMTFSSSGCNPSYRYMYSDSGKVYYYQSLNNTFALLFDINKNPGEHFSEAVGGDSVVYKVDSISFININGHPLKKLFVHITHYPFSGIDPYEGEFIENLGNTRYLFPWENDVCVEGNVGGGHNPPHAGPLGCYTDSILGFYNFGTIADCFAQSYSPPADSFSIYPNPTNTDGSFVLEIRSYNDWKKDISIFSALGKEINFTSFFRG